MEKINLLDLNNDMLDIIGDYVLIDNWERIETDYFKRRDEESKQCIFKYVDSKLKSISCLLKGTNKRPFMRKMIVFFVNCGICKNHSYVEEYLKLKT